MVYKCSALQLLKYVEISHLERIQFPKVSHQLLLPLVTIDSYEHEYSLP